MKVIGRVSAFPAVVCKEQNQIIEFNGGIKNNVRKHNGEDSLSLISPYNVNQQNENFFPSNGDVLALPEGSSIPLSQIFTQTCNPDASRSCFHSRISHHRSRPSKKVNPGSQKNLLGALFTKSSRVKKSSFFEICNFQMIKQSSSTAFSEKNSRKKCLFCADLLF